MKTKTKTLIKGKQKKAEELAQDIEDALTYQAEELREYSLTAWVLSQKVREFIQSDGKLSTITACDLASDIEGFTRWEHYLCGIARDAHDLINLLHDIEKLRTQKGRIKND